jgi:hypothetical protein
MEDVGADRRVVFRDPIGLGLRAGLEAALERLS